MNQSINETLNQTIDKTTVSKQYCRSCNGTDHLRSNSRKCPNYGKNNSNKRTQSTSPTTTQRIAGSPTIDQTNIDDISQLLNDSDLFNESQLVNEQYETALEQTSNYVAETLINRIAQRRSQEGKLYRKAYIENIDQYLQIDTHNIGPFNVSCKFFSSLNFASERARDGTFSLCCHKGKVKLPPLTKLPQLLYDLYNENHQLSKNFLENIRNYNSALAFASTSAKLDPKMDTHGPYFFKIIGQVYHCISTTTQTFPNQKPSYSQLYILDSSSAIDIRMQNTANSKCDHQVINL